MQEIDLNFYNAIQGIIEPYYSLLLSLDESVKRNATEIRIKAERPLMLTVDNKPVWVCINGVSYTEQTNAVVVKRQDVDSIFLSLCENSVYTHEEELKQGFISLKNGHRAGVCGTKTPTGGIRDVSGITIRIARQVFGCSHSLYMNYKPGGTLIAGPPGSGKTTVLRDLLYNLSAKEHLRISVIDTRGEIAACRMGVPKLNIGDTVDIFTNYEKPEGIQMALRTQNPQIIAFDELGSMDEVKAISEACGGGADIIATVHTGSEQDLLYNKKVRLLINNNYIKNIVMLNKAPDYGCVFIKENSNA